MRFPSHMYILSSFPYIHTTLCPSIHEADLAWNPRAKFFLLQLILFCLFLFGKHDLSLQEFPFRWSVFTKSISRVFFLAISITLISQFPRPPGRISCSNFCSLFLNSLLGVGGTKYRICTFLQASFWCQYFLFPGTAQPFSSVPKSPDIFLCKSCIFLLLWICRRC